MPLRSSGCTWWIPRASSSWPVAGASKASPFARATRSIVSVTVADRYRGPHRQFQHRAPPPDRRHCRQQRVAENHYAASVVKAKLPFTTVPMDRRARWLAQSRMNYVALVDARPERDVGVPASWPGTRAPRASCVNRGRGPPGAGADVFFGPGILLFIILLVAIQTVAASFVLAFFILQGTRLVVVSSDPGDYPLLHRWRVDDEWPLLTSPTLRLRARYVSTRPELAALLVAGDRRHTCRGLSWKSVRASARTFLYLVNAHVTRLVGLGLHWDLLLTSSYRSHPGPW